MAKEDLSRYTIVCEEFILTKDNLKFVIASKTDAPEEVVEPISDPGSHHVFAMTVKCKSLKIEYPTVFGNEVDVQHCQISQKLFSNLGGCSTFENSYDDNGKLNLLGQVIFMNGFHCNDVSFI